MSWDLPDTYQVKISAQELDGDVLRGRYNVGYSVDDSEASQEVFDRGDGYVLWTLLEETTPETDNFEDMTAYHLARARNAEVMSENNLNVPETALFEAEIDGEYTVPFLATPYLDHRSFEQRPKIPAGDMRRENPHMQDPFNTQERRRFEASIENAMKGVDDRKLVEEGKIVNAGNGGIDDHNKNWGFVQDELFRLDIGEVPARGPVWDKIPYSGPEEFYSETGLREDARQLLQGIQLDPKNDIPEELRQLMQE